jgi:sulfide:quinone oxidoreductase
MKKLLILGAGSAGTMVANRMNRLLDRDEWQITLVDQNETHYYQPGFLFIPFGIYSKNDVIKPKRDFTPGLVIMSPIEHIDEHNQVKLKGGLLNYDYLVIASYQSILSKPA